MSESFNASSAPFQPSNVFSMMQNKEEFEQYQMRNQYNMAKVTLDEAFATWQKEQLIRRRRFVNQHGLDVALEKGYHIPFWQWWMSKLNSNNNCVE